MKECIYKKCFVGRLIKDANCKLEFPKCTKEVSCFFYDKYMDLKMDADAFRRQHEEV